MNFRRLNVIVASLSVASLAVMAYAAVTFDPATGEGFVGKGDVQDAFGWNDQTLQANAGLIGFEYESSSLVTGVCEWTTNEGRNTKVHTKTITSGTEISGTVVYSAKKNPQNKVTGFDLTGYEGDAVVTEGDSTYDNPNFPMVVGGPCPGNPGNEGVWISVTASGSEGSGLYAIFDGVKKLIWSAAPPTP